MLISCIWKYLEKHLPIFVERAEPEEPDEGVKVQLLVLDGSASDGPTSRCSKSGKKPKNQYDKLFCLTEEENKIRKRQNYVLKTKKLKHY